MSLKNDIDNLQQKNKIENFSKEDIDEIEQIKNKPEKLLEMLIKLKEENLYLHSQIKQLSIECNQRLRDNLNKV